MKKIILSTLLLISINLFSQSGWDEKSFYKRQGETLVICDTTIYPKYSLNSYGDKVLTAYVRKCKRLEWTQEYYTGYIKYWFKNEWNTEWADGSFWRCYWVVREVKIN